MSDFLGNLLARTFDDHTGLAPRLPSRFEQGPSISRWAVATDEAENPEVTEQTESVAAPRAEPSQSIGRPVTEEVEDADRPVSRSTLHPSLLISSHPSPPSPPVPPVESAAGLVPAIPATSSRELNISVPPRPKVTGLIEPRHPAKLQVTESEMQVAAHPLPVSVVRPLDSSPSESPLAEGRPRDQRELPRLAASSLLESTPDARLQPSVASHLESNNQLTGPEPAFAAPLLPVPRILPLAPPPAESLSRARTERSGEPTIRVTIGHIEIRSAPPAPRPAPRPARPRMRPSMQLDDYLKQRGSSRE